MRIVLLYGMDGTTGCFTNNLSESITTEAFARQVLDIRNTENTRSRTYPMNLKKNPL